MSPPNISLVLIMICFWLTMWLVYRYLIVPIGQVLAERQRRLDDAQDEWDSVQGEYLTATERLEQEMQEAARAAANIRADHRQRALADRQKTLETARQQADQTLHNALSELDAAAASAGEELRSSALELARLFAGQLLGREVRS